MTVGTFGYVLLMHWRSPIAWLGYRGGWARLRACQRRLHAHRHYPTRFAAVTWMQVVGLAPLGAEPRALNGRRRFDSVSAVLARARLGCVRRAREDFLDWLFPASRGMPHPLDVAVLGLGADRD